MAATEVRQSSTATPDQGLRDNIWNFYIPIEMPGVWYFDYVRTLKRINLYWSGRYETGDYDSQGFKKYFYNIVKPACDIASKFIGLQTKDIMLVPDHTDDEQLLWLMRQDLRQWMRDNKFNVLLDDIKTDLPKYGSVVIKKHKTKEWARVKLENMRFDIATESLESSNFVYEVLLMTPREIVEMRDGSNWDATAVEELFRRGMEPKYLVYETYDVNLKQGGKKWKRTFRGDLFTYAGTNNILMRTAEARINRPNDYLPSIVLYEDEVDELPYREVHFERIPGRWLGLGFVEYLFDNQIRRNEVVNVKSKGLLFTSLKIYQTKDQTIGNNILTEMANGDIIKTTDEVKPVLNEERNLAYFNDEIKDWDENTQDKTFSQDVAQGDNLPSRTPTGVANMQLSMVSNYFDEKRKIIGMFLRDLLLDDIIPRFKEEVAPEHKFMFMGSSVEMEKLADTLVKAHVWTDALKYAKTKGNGFFPSPQEMQREQDKIKSKIMSGKGINVSIPSGYYTNAKFKLDIVTTGEQIDTGSVKQTLQLVMQIVATNPAVLQDPSTRSILFMLMELSGVDPVEMDLLKQQLQQQQQQGQGQQPQGGPPGQGGSIVVPKGMANPSFIPKRQVL